jgi:hypothetical protein
MSKKPKIDHDYDKGKDKLTITIHRYSLKRKKDSGCNHSRVEGQS